MRHEIRTALAHPKAPLVALIVILLCSLGARALHLGEPCATPCVGPSAHTLIFDEAYYVNAARVIDGITPPAGSNYASAPHGKDPNAEHPQLAKLIMAGTIKLFGDGPLGWRFGSILFGMIALLSIYGLVRAARGSPWLAVGATAVMALDNLALIQSRIATLDIYMLALVLVAAIFYLRGWRLRAGVMLGLACCTKEVSIYAFLVFVLLEGFRFCWARSDGVPLWPAAWQRTVPLSLTLLATAVTTILGLWMLDLIVPAYDPGTGITYGGNPFMHLAHIFSYGTSLTVIPNATGISSTPWQWLLNQQPIDYARVAINGAANGKILSSRAIFDARGEMNPFIIFMAVPGLCSAIAAAWNERDEVAALGAAWCVGTFVPFVIEAAVYQRISYLYYMLLVMPGIYLVTARLFAKLPRTATFGWAAMLVYGFLNLYPIRTLSGH